MIELTEHPEGVVLPVRAQAGASKNGIRGEQNGMLKVSVTQVAEKGKANKALAETIAKGLGLNIPPSVLAPRRRGDRMRAGDFRC